MIPFKCRGWDSTWTPFIRKEEIWEYAEKVVEDYKPSLMKDPEPLNVPHFLESYLGATLDYQDIYYDRTDDPIAGATIFNDSRIRVFDREGQCTRTIRVPAGTIIIDNSTVELGNKGFEAFTGLHEGGHFLMHNEAYRKRPVRGGCYRQTKTSSVVCCRRSTMYGKLRESGPPTPEQIREQQANIFAAFAAMPRQTFVPLATELIRERGNTEGYLYGDEGDFDIDTDLEYICGKLMEVYGVSFTAAKIHLKELDLFVPFSGAFSRWYLKEMYKKQRYR